MNSEAIELTRQFQEITRPRSMRSIVDAILRISEPDENGELSYDVDRQLDALNLSAAEKAEAYGIVYHQWTTEACGNKELSAFYDQRAKAAKNRAERLKGRLYEEMQRMGVTELRGSALRACVELSPHSVEVTHPDAVPEQFKTTVVETRIEKKRLIEALKAGAEFSFAKLVRSTHLRFR